MRGSPLTWHVVAPVKWPLKVIYNDCIMYSGTIKTENIPVSTSPPTSPTSRPSTLTHRWSIIAPNPSSLEEVWDGVLKQLNDVALRNNFKTLLKYLSRSNNDTGIISIIGLTLRATCFLAINALWCWRVKDSCIVSMDNRWLWAEAPANIAWQTCKQCLTAWQCCTILRIAEKFLATAFTF